MRDMLDAQTEAQEVIRDRLGVEAQVGFHYNGETLENVSIAMNAGEVKNRNVTELESAAQIAVKRAFDEKPKAIYIQLYFTAN